MGWHGVLAQRAPPHRAAAKRRRGLGQGRLWDGRERRSLRSPSERLTAQRHELNENAVTGGSLQFGEVLRGRASGGGQGAEVEGS